MTKFEISEKEDGFYEHAYKHGYICIERVCSAMKFKIVNNSNVFVADSKKFRTMREVLDDLDVPLKATVSFVGKHEFYNYDDYVVITSSYFNIIMENEKYFNSTNYIDSIDSAMKIAADYEKDYFNGKG